MVEIAIALAVIGFALVAIIGVLPAGMNVQKENREETIINQDATVFLEAIRNGARGLDDLTNYVIIITNFVQRYNIIRDNGTPTETNASGPLITNWYTFASAWVNNEPSGSPELRLTNGARIIGLLSIPKYVPLNVNGDFNSNYVSAQFRAMSGSAAEKFPQKNVNILELAFAYRLVPELSPVPLVETNDMYIRTYETNLHELRLAFRWPLLPGNLFGNGRHSFRTLAGGRVVVTGFFGQPGDLNQNGRNLYFLQNSTVTMVP